MSIARSTQECQNLQYFRLLRSSQWFGSLPPAVAQSLFNAGSCVEHPAGQPIYLEDSPDQGLFGIVDGTVHFELIDSAGRRILLSVAGPGHWFGNILATPDFRTLVTAQAFRRVRAWRVPVFALRRLICDMPELGRAYTELIMMKIVALTERICVMHRPSAFVQVAGSLAFLYRTLRENAPSPHGTLIYMTQSDLADMTGLSRQTINGIIGRLEDGGLIRVHHRMIEIRDPEALSEYCAYRSEKVTEMI